MGPELNNPASRNLAGFPVRGTQPFSSGRSALPRYWAMIAILVMVLIRTINLGSDAPKGLPAEEDYGIYVDEGYKTLSARNMIVFGNEHWHPGDDYQSWVSASPITQGAFYLAFASFGQNLETARMVSVTCFAVFLICFGIAYYRERPPPVFWAGLLMLGFERILWLASRTAIFEITVLCIIYAALLLLRRFSHAALTNAIVIALVGLVVTFGVKQNAPTIVVPALFGILAVWAVQTGRVRQFLIFLLFGAAIFVVFKGLWSIGFPLPIGIPGVIRKVDLFPPTKLIERFLVNPVLKADPFVVILAHACAISVLLHQPKFFENNPYRASIGSIVFLGTAVLATIPLVRLRYCALLLPAFILFVVEWWIAQKRNFSHAPKPEKQGLSGYVAVIVLFFLAFDLVFLVTSLLSSTLNAPEAAGRTVSFMLPLAGALSFLFWKKRNRVLSTPVLRTFIFVTMAAFALFNGYKVINFVVWPSWQVRTISNELTKILPEGATIAGDWMPVFAIGTNLRVLYTNPVFNGPERFRDLRPSYFLDCETEGGEVVKARIERLDGVKLGPPLLESEYTGVRVRLYRLHYDKSEFHQGAESASDAHRN